MAARRRLAHAEDLEGSDSLGKAERAQVLDLSARLEHQDLLPETRLGIRYQARLRADDQAARALEELAFVHATDQPGIGDRVDVQPAVQATERLLEAGLVEEAHPAA